MLVEINAATSNQQPNGIECSNKHGVKPRACGSCHFRGQTNYGDTPISQSIQTLKRNDV